MSAAASNDGPEDQELPEPDFIPGAPLTETKEQPEEEFYILPSNHYPIKKSARRLFNGHAKLKKLFAHFGYVVELRYESVSGQYQLSPITPAQLSSRLEDLPFPLLKHVNVKDEVVLKKSICSKATAELLLATREATENLYPITIVVNSPIMIEGPDGKGDILGAGYHHHGRGTLVTRGTKPPIVPLQEACETLLELLSAFKFTTAADKLRALAVLLTPALVWGGLLNGEHIPLFLSTADKPGAGKGFLLQVCAAFYGETLTPQAKRKGGVGSFDEDFNIKLLTGKPFVFLDNLREQLDSPHIESFLTADGPFLVRTPHRTSVEVDKRKYIVFASSNGFETTADLETRVLRVSIRKRPDDFNYKQFSGGNALKHVQKNQPYYLGCIFSLVNFWLESGKKRSDETRHRCRDWSRVVDWILVHAIGEKVTGRMLDRLSLGAGTPSPADEFGFLPPEDEESSQQGESENADN